MAAGAATSEGGAAAAARLAEAHAQLTADRSIQFALPEWVEPKPPAWLEPVARALRALGPYMIYFFWGAVILGAAVILFLVVREARGVAWRLPWRRARRQETGSAAFAPDLQTARILLAEADALAARGDYEAAVHLLLRRSVADIAERIPGFLRPSLTARDIAAATMLPERARVAFAAIARVVEAALFARRPVGAAGWGEARGAYERFALQGAWA